MTTQPIVGSAIQNTQQLHLDLRLQFADFVEENWPLSGEFEQSWLGGISAAECSLFVTEQFTFDKVLGQSGTVDVDQWFVTSMRRFVNSPRHKLLTSSGFS